MRTFQLNDWVTSNNSNEVFQIKDIFTDGYTQYITSIKLEPRTKWDSGVLYGQYPADICNLWQPLKGTPCWFYGHTNPLPQIGIFSHFSNGKFVATDPSDSGAFWIFNCCEPFIGKLPSILNIKS